jgi:hypothetical protein
LTFHFINSRFNDVVVSEAVFKAVVGYLGTIEMPPRQADLEGNLDAMRNCIRRLRVEKKVHTVVLFCLGRDMISLLNHHCAKLAEYPADQVSFCGTCADDRRFFGLVTNSKRTTDEDDEEEKEDELTSSSCHVFMTESAPLSAQEAESRSRAFQFDPTMSVAEQGCFDEFPLDSDPIITAVMSTYGKSEKSKTSPSAKSGNASSSVPGSSVESSPTKASNASSSSSRLDVRAMPFPRTAGASSGDDSFNTERLDEQNSAENIRQSMQKYLQSKHQRLKKVSEQFQQLETIGPASKYGHDDGSRRRSPSVRSFEDDDGRGFSLPARPSLQPQYSQPPPATASNHSNPSPLARYLCHSESNLSQLSAAGAALSLVSAAEAETVTAKERGKGRTTILRPGEQYPSEEPGVLKNLLFTQQLHQQVKLRSKD